jgi:methionine-rich copper-binding protein CopC
MRLFLSIVGFTAALLLPNPLSIVQAHSRLDSAAPAPDSVVSDAPAEVRIWFTQELRLNGNQLTVTDAAGNRVDNDDAHVDQSDPDRKQMVASLQPLSAGQYTVNWVSQSAEDGHEANDSYAFSVGAASDVPAAGDCPGDEAATS